MSRPNILLITTDQHNAGVLGCAGNRCVRTPHLDRLAQEGVCFEEAFTPHCVCTPARTSIFTGQTAACHGVNYNINLREDQPDPPRFTGLDAEATAFPQVLADHGYRTGFVGKLHAKQAGSRHFGLQTCRLAEGKGQFVEFGSGPDDYRLHLLEQGYPDSAWRTWELPGYAEQGWVTSPLPVEDTIDGWTGAEAVRYLESVSGPFFCWVSFSGPHTPWDPPRPYDRLYNPGEIPLPARREGELEEKAPRWVDRLAQTIPATPPTSIDGGRPGGIANAYSRFSDKQVREMLSAYYGQITLIDDQIGRVLSVLESRGLTENTLVIFTADHGDYLGNNWAFFKYGAQYDSLARIPFVMRWPAGIRGGQRRNDLVSLVDIAPTVLAAVGLRPVDPVVGCSLLPLLSGDAGTWRDALVWLDGPRCVTTRQWRYLRWGDGMEELYDRVSDPHDLHNLVARGNQHPVRQRLSAKLEAARKDCRG